MLTEAGFLGNVSLNGQNIKITDFKVKFTSRKDIAIFRKRCNIPNEMS